MDTPGNLFMDSWSFMNRSIGMRMGYHGTKQFSDYETWPDTKQSVDRVDGELSSGISENDARRYHRILTGAQRRERGARRKEPEFTTSPWRELQDAACHEEDVERVRANACKKWCDIVWDTYRSLPAPVDMESEAAIKAMESFVRDMHPDSSMADQEAVAKRAIALLEKERKLRTPPFLDYGAGI